VSFDFFGPVLRDDLTTRSRPSSEMRFEEDLDAQIAAGEP
jgi:hypothetical protein